MIDIRGLPDGVYEDEIERVEVRLGGMHATRIIKVTIDEAELLRAFDEPDPTIVCGDPFGG